MDLANAALRQVMNMSKFEPIFYIMYTRTSVVRWLLWHHIRSLKTREVGVVAAFVVTAFQVYRDIKKVMSGVNDDD